MEKRTLTPEMIEYAYRNACFPMAESSSGPIYWYEPEPRTLLPLDTFHASKRLIRTARSSKYEIRFNSDFEAVVRRCAEREETWINEEIIAAYTELHVIGHAHSVEAWLDEKMVGGLYGVAFGGAFMGESMFSSERDASKVCLLNLVGRLKQQGFILLDAQLQNPHLVQFGAVDISREAYRQLLEQALRLQCQFGPQQD